MDAPITAHTFLNFLAYAGIEALRQIPEVLT